MARPREPVSRSQSPEPTSGQPVRARSPLRTVEDNNNIASNSTEEEMVVDVVNEDPFVGVGQDNAAPSSDTMEVVETSHELFMGPSSVSDEVEEQNDVFNHSFNADITSGTIHIPGVHPSIFDPSSDESDSGDDNEEAVGDSSFLIYGGTEAIQNAIHEKCTSSFAHVGNSCFRHEPRHTGVGVVYPREPEVGDRVEIHLRLNDTGLLRVFADYYGLGQYGTNFRLHTLGYLNTMDRHFKDLRNLLASRHFIVGEVVTVATIVGTGGLVKKNFHVQWEAGERCSSI
ncbi:hypothetical protein BJ508DRAFT_326126 [Ascobolus immersus RN42]|uniref:Uncharacterized protein n=1 Tax=Ascobolus immersus RN42 TaxID=1160509 RepID=A0A3N4I6F3_ASCIM|nr:hypothetical protein BJ508DRAFT_326126 [Ascobolus immersus RN42]